MRKRLFLGLLGSLLFLGSCEKEKVVSLDGLDGAIIGSWSKTDVIPSGRSEVDLRYFDMVTTYRFDLTKEYSYAVDFYGFKDENPEEIMGYSKKYGDL